LRLLRTVRVRLTLWYVLLLSLILAVFCTFLYARLAHDLRAELDRSLSTQATQVFTLLNAEDARSAIADAANELQPGTAIALYDATGGRVVASDPTTVLPDLAAAMLSAVRSGQSPTTVTAGGRKHWRVLTLPVRDHDHLVGLLQVARSEDDIESALRQLLTLMAFAVPMTIACAVAGGLFLAGRAFNPVVRLTRAAEEISETDLSRRLDAHRTDDELGRLASAFDRMLDRLDRAFQRQRQFTADASHELRTPLTVLAGRVDIALQEARSAHEYRIALEQTRDDTARLRRLLGELLTLARADSGQHSLTLEPIDLGDLVIGAARAMEQRAAERQVRLTFHGNGPVQVHGDQTRLTQLVINLVDNAVQYSPAAGNVKLGVTRVGNDAVLTVTDHGIGIAAEHLPHLFERFYRVHADRSRADGGAGLGLAISRWIVKAHRGTIAVESQVGCGTTVTVRLPAIPP
jgi:heavy metal sensor kinase